jgi:ABC-type polysaccharide/polyol phosphate transport system ATPase subunit
MSSDDTLIRAKNLTKIYPSPLAPVSRLKHALFGTEPRGDAGHTVLKSVDLEVRRGETVGILGRNGAGKSTLLGILGNVIEPTFGTVERFGKIALLLEIGAGFHPNFTGRQNARLFCSIMGMTRAQGEERIGRIADFADLGDYFDLPLRTYSSGMHARLGFSCAVHVDADLVIVDETLAVGDASFRMKCFRLIEQMKRDGQTFLIVSHSPNVIANFCTRAVVIERGEKVFDGTTLGAAHAYKHIRTLHEKETAPLVRIQRGPKPHSEQANKLTMENFLFEESTDGDGERVGLIRAELVAHAEVPRPIVSFGIRNGEGIALCAASSLRNQEPLPALTAGQRIPLVLSFFNRLCPAAYYVSCSTSEMVGDVNLTYASYPDVIRFDVMREVPTQGIVDLELTIDVEEGDIARRA